MTTEIVIRAVVQNVIHQGKHGPYAVATSESLVGSVTFSLEPTVWQEKDWPQAGSVVYLTKLRQKRAGWRAKQGRHWLLSDEQRADKETVMKSLRVFVESLKTKFFPSEEDKAWKQWVDFKNADTDELKKLLESDVRDSFKKRALFLLLVPSADFNPLYWNREVGKFYHRTEVLKRLSPELLDYAVELIITFYQLLKPLHNAHPKNVVEGGGSITVYMSVPDKFHDALQFYNKCILELLSLLPRDNAMEIFPLYSLLDISTYSGMDEASGYYPLQSLFSHDKVDEYWKVEADARMRSIILAELSGKNQPREKWENALLQYAEIINSQLFGEKLNYSLELFTSQIQFLMDQRQGHDRLLDTWNIAKLLRRLAGPADRDLRHTIARYVLLEDTSECMRFSIYSEETQQAAAMMLEEFADDRELVSRIRELEKERAKKQAQNIAHSNSKKSQEEAILAQMR